MVTVPAEI